MWLLFKAELQRFRVPGAIAFAAHLLVLGFMSRTSDLAQQSMLTYRVIAACYVLAGLLLGAYQMSGYARPAAWLHLIHRPVPAWRIGLALMAAAVAWLAIAIALPILLIAAWQAGFTARVVDLRHWLMPLSALTLSVIGYALGAYALLANRRVGFGPLIFLLLLLVARAQGLDALLLQGLVAAYLGVLLWIVFRANRSAMPASPWRLGLVFVPVSVAIYFALLTAMKIGMQTLWILLGNAPATASVPPPHSVQEAWRATDKALMLEGIRASHDPRATAWAAQVDRQEKLERYGPLLEELPARGQFTNGPPLSFADSANDTLWTFSHDRMRFVGRGLADDRSDRGTLTPPGATAFPSPTMPVMGALGIGDAGSAVLLGERSAWRYDTHTRAMTLLLALPAPEVFSSVPMRVGTHLAALSDKAIYIGNGNRASHEDMVRIPLQGPINVLHRVSIADVDDGYLVSLAYLRNNRYESFERMQQVVHVDANGQWRIVSTRPLVQDFPTWFRYMDWWLSPLIDHSSEGLKMMFAEQPGLSPADPMSPPASMRWLAAICALLCATLTVGLARRLHFGVTPTLTWTVVNALLGPAGLIGLWLAYGQGVSLRVAGARPPLRGSPKDMDGAGVTAI